MNFILLLPPFIIMLQIIFFRLQSYNIIIQDNLSLKIFKVRNKARNGEGHNIIIAALELNFNQLFSSNLGKGTLVVLLFAEFVVCLLLVCQILWNFTEETANKSLSVFHFVLMLMS